ncbi:antirepressor regulating drug resistance protein [Desulfosporosinus orientis DSM 765]|uniref:Antirepressor regulating drug resistance protein n=1 Tax=Desulfosporosinus orientis (strain ATCC 19365 / DSM 765 / NCIMB 8382 / VKM B-1628 / Singapore I) TaxID=768706 RepID=G7WD30_DESOD|nr:DUF5301 domain-containing protein [Desulfosporosinus orientis]AET67225.1 antirepressor regulating drug resistance protein [Desulfosporosinus orientis DSM 765]
MEQFLQDVFLAVLNMSITAGYAILFVLLARLLLKKTSKIFSYCLWGVVLFRLISPVSFSFALSFFGFMKKDSMEHIPAGIGMMAQPQVDLGVDYVSQAVTSSLPAATPIASANPMQIILFIASLIWALGVLSLLAYSLVSYGLLKRKVSQSILVRDNIWECHAIQSPFVLGFLKPKIYLPPGFSEGEKSYILKHEEIHIRRYDYLIKPLAYFLLCLHWFNPLVWLSFILMTKDMEMSCDEAVIKELGKEIKQDYSRSLLSLALSHKMISGSPLAFGEGSAKSRIKNILNYKQPTFWGMLAGAAGILILSLGLISNPQSSQSASESLNINHAAKISAAQGQLIIRVHGQGATLITGEEFGEWLAGVSVGWAEKQVRSPYELSPTLTIYIDGGPEPYRLNFYDSEKGLAMLSFDGSSRYYAIPPQQYEQVYSLWGLRSYIIPEAVTQALLDGKKTNRRSVQDVPNEKDYQVIEIGKATYYLYEDDGKYYCERPYLFIRELTEESYKGALTFAHKPSGSSQESLKESAQEDQEIAELIENNLQTIMSSPLQSSNPDDYIQAHDREYESILKYGGEKALPYLLGQFKAGNAGGLRGQIMMRLAKELLGVRNNVSDETLSPQEWFSQLQIRQEVSLPDFAYQGNDPIAKLVYQTEVEKHKGRGGFCVVAPHLFASYREGGKLKVFVTTYAQTFRLYDNVLSEEEGGIIPVAITYQEGAGGSYTLESYEQAKDGAYFASSIQEFCVMPVSGKRIEGLAQQILTHYGDYRDIINLQRKNLTEHLQRNNRYGVSLYQPRYKIPAKLIPIT